VNLMYVWRFNGAYLDVSGVRRYSDRQAGYLVAGHLSPRCKALHLFFNARYDDGDFSQRGIGSGELLSSAESTGRPSP